MTNINKQLESIDLSIKEIESLSYDLNGFTTQDGKVILKGFLKEKLSLATKFWLNELNASILEILKNAETLKNDTIKSIGTEDENGNISIPIFLPGTEEKDESGNIIKAEYNPKYLELQKELEALYNQVKTLQYKPILLSELENIVSDDDYKILFKLIKQDNND